MIHGVPYDDTAPVPRWEARDVYDLAIAVVQWDGTVVESQRWLERHGALSEAQLAEARGFLAARPRQLVCCWGNAEFEFIGVNLTAVIASFASKRPWPPVASRHSLPRAIRSRLGHRFSMSMNLLTPLFGLRAAPFHTALCDCEGEAVIITAFIRHLCSQRMPPAPPPSATSRKRLQPPAWEEDEYDFE